MMRLSNQFSPTRELKGEQGVIGLGQGPDAVL